MNAKPIAQDCLSSFGNIKQNMTNDERLSGLLLKEQMFVHLDQIKNVLGEKVSYYKFSYFVIWRHTK